MRNVLHNGLLAATLIAVTLGACHSQDTAEVEPEPSWDTQVRLAKVADNNPAADVVEINLEAVEAEIELKPGIKTKMWTYNGSFPGPTIEAKRGDTLIVHFKNNLPQETTLHWHGVEVPADMDGSHLSQHPIAPGQSFRYEFKLTTASTFWYHPHVHTDEQVEKGLYGAMVVRDPEEDQRLALPSKELVLVLDDILLGENGQIAPFTSANPAEKATLALNGREGNHVMVNGRSFPNIDLTAGEPVRLRLINAANSRFFRLSFPDQTVYRIGGDGGLIKNPTPIQAINTIRTGDCGTHCSHFSSKPTARDTSTTGPATISNPDPSKGLMLVPGERADIVLVPKAVTDNFAFIEWHDFPRGRHSITTSTDGKLVLTHGIAGDGAATPFRMVRLALTPDSASLPYTPPTTLREITPLTTTADTPKLRVDLGHDAPADNGDVAMYAFIDNQGKGIPFAQLTDNEALTAKVGQTYIWEVTNHTMHDHPFHPHGFSFQWVETEYVDLDTPANNRIEKATFTENKDTVRIPTRPGILDGRSKTIMRFAVRFDDSGREGKAVGSGKMPSVVGGMHQPGGWMVHCHILEHEVLGMTTYLNLTMP